ncbi:MAG TPA: N-acetylmuramoyl-L-alanine amidase [Phycisphaerae bacterium]|nr:N-acetylmuramoyl-L-alanine amidase [Phycisphaerae bacterium]
MCPRQVPAVVLLAAAALLAAGCGDANALHAVSQRIDAPDRTISVYQLAGRLGLRVVRSGRGLAQLAGGGNAVSIFPEPTPAVYVNGAALAVPGRIRSVDSTIFLSEEVAPLVRVRLRGPPGPVRPPPPPPDGPPPARYAGLVVLDPGHGGRQPGAIACTGMFEKDVTLPVAHMVRQRLESWNVRVIMTRTDDRFMDLEPRAEVANRAGADLFVSIHADSAPNRWASGYTVYVARGAAAPTSAAAECVNRRLRPAAATSRGVRQADFRVLVHASCPAMLVELGYLSNRTEARLLAEDGYRRKLADAIAAGIVDCLKR